MFEASKPKRREGMWLWLAKIFGGFMIIFLLAIHFLVNHLFAPNGLLTYDDVIRYYSNPIIPVMEIGFLAFVVSHSLIGVRSIFLDLNPSDKLLRIVDGLLLIIGIVSIVYGIWLIITLALR